MRHSRIAKSKRHKKLKTVNDLSNYNVVSDKLLAKNKEQAIPRKWTQIMEYKETNKQAAKQTKEGNSKKRSNKLKKKYDTLSVKTGVQTTIERGMTRVPKPMPEIVEKGILESDYQFINRLNRMVSKSIAEATLEDHFDVDLGGKVKTTAAEDKAAAALISPEESGKIEKKRNKRRQKDQKRKERRLKKQTKLVKMIKSQEFSFKKETVQYGDLVHEPPALTFSKRAKLNTVK